MRFHVESALQSIIQNGRLCLLAGMIVAFSPLLTAAADQSDIKDATPEGWERDTDLLNFKIDRYKTASGSIELELMAFPATQKSAKDWLDTMIPLMTKEDRDAGRQVHVINDDELGTDGAKGPMNTSADGVDMTTQTVMVLRPGKENKDILTQMRAIVRSGEPVQFSLLELGRAKPTPTEYRQASQLRFEARMPMNANAAFMGEEKMVQLMTAPLLGPSTPTPSKPKVASKPKESTPVARTVASGSKSSHPGNFPALPGPQVRLSGDFLPSLPAGYRMRAKTTHYWTNDSMTATTQTFLTLFENGQFEIGRFSISGGMGGVTGTVHASDKTGSHGSVYGDTNPAGPGTRSVASSTKKGLDPSKYGTYYIAGKQIKFTYANGKVEKKPFKTDGYKELVIDDKRYFIDTAKGWKRNDSSKASFYKSLDGKYTARVTKLDYDISDCHKWLTRYRGRIKAKNNLISAGPIKAFRAGYKDRYAVATGSHVQRLKSGATINQEIFLKCDNRNGHLLQLTRHTGDSGNKQVLALIKHLD